MDERASKGGKKMAKYYYCECNVEFVCQKNSLSSDQ